MAMTVTPSFRERFGAALATAVIVAALGYALVVGLAVRFATPHDAPLATFAMLPPPPEPPVRIVPQPAHVHRPRGAASPPNLRSTATPVVAPEPVVIIPVPPPVVTAPVAGLASDPSAGASDRAGPGTGAGGEGNGTGSGGSGDGDGDGDETRPRHIKGNVRIADLPAWARASGFHGTVALRFYVETDGQVSDCRIARSSGNAEIDAVTCRAIEQRFRYRPWRDADGHPVPSTVLREQEWDVEGSDPPAGSSRR